MEVDIRVQSVFTPVTFKMPASVIRDLRAYAAASELTLGEIVSRAVSRFLAAEREHG